MTDFYQTLKNCPITFEEANSILMRINGLLDILSNTAAWKDISKEKKAVVLKNGELLLEGLKLIYSGFVDGILDHDNVNRFGTEGSFSDRHKDDAMDTFDYVLPILESEESAEQRRNQERQGLKILTTDQMLSRLPISLAQLKAENNSEKLENEIRQLLYSLCR